MSGRFSRTIYVGNLPHDIRELEVKDLFYKYGRILDVELKIPSRPSYYLLSLRILEMLKMQSRVEMVITLMVVI